jgi:16S rRNA (guanine527-N7)-methyltransferase
MESIEFYIDSLFKWNKIHNLTAMKSRDEIYSSIYDSLYPLREVKYGSVLDIGTGAGFPGLFFGIVNREEKTYLVEPNKKRTSFLNYIKSGLKLHNTTILSDRVENIEIDGGVDLITSRAVTDTEMLLSLSKHLWRDGTEALFYKGSNVHNEVEHLNKKYRIVSRGVRNYLVIEV